MYYEGPTGIDNEFIEEGSTSSSSNYLTASSGSTSNNNEITEEAQPQPGQTQPQLAQAHVVQAQFTSPHGGGFYVPGNYIYTQSVFQSQAIMPPQAFQTMTPQDLSWNMDTGASSHLADNIDRVTIFVAYNGHWEYEGMEWVFENSKSSIMVVSKRITLSEISNILKEQLSVDKKFDRLKLEVHYRTGSPWFPVTEIQNNEDLSVFISETLKTKLPLCVTPLRCTDEIYSDDDEISSDADEFSSDVDEERQKDYVTVFVAYNGKWENDDKEWFFKNSKSSTIFVPKHITLSKIKDILNTELEVDKELYRLKLEVHYRTGSPWFPVTQIQDTQDLSVFISETSKTKLPLCVSLLKHYELLNAIEERRKENNTAENAENRLLRAIWTYDWVKAREIIYNSEEVTWTSKLTDNGFTAFHYAVGEFKDNEVVTSIVNALQSNNELPGNNDGINPAHIAAGYGNTEALTIMLDSNPKCLFISDNGGDLAINCALMAPKIETFQYLFKKMPSYKDEFDTFLRGKSALKLLGQVIDTGLIDVAYNLIKDYPSMATKVQSDITTLERIIRKPDFFYSGTHYNLYQRFVYRYVPIENNSLGTTVTSDFENNSLGGTDHTADIENQETPKKDKFFTKHTRRCLQDVIRIFWVKLWKTTLLHVPHVKHLKEDKVKHNTTIKLLRLICEEIEKSHDIIRLYSSPFCLAVENNTDEAIDVLITYFKELYPSEKDGQDIYQLTVLNRSEKVYNYIRHHQGSSKVRFSISEYNGGNNILHLAGRLTPIHKLNAASGAALQMQQELQWFEEVEKTVPLAHARALNDNKETPMMVFRKEHKELRKDGEEWMKKTADSYTITAALIITIVFAAAITVPGGNDDKSGKPIYETKLSFIIFAVADAISLFTATTSLLLFLSILTARYADEDFLYKLPKRLIYGLVMLFVSVTAMMIAFSATLYIMFGQEKQWVLIPIAALSCLPIASFMTLQFPLLVELISSTYGHGLFGKEKDYTQSSANANKKKWI